MAKKKSDLKPFQVIAEIVKIETKREGLRITADTNEVPPEAMALLMGYKTKQGWLMFAPVEREFEAEDVIKLPDIPVEKGQLSPSQRLRNRLFVYYNWKYQTKDNFNAWYESVMDKIGLQYLDKLPKDERDDY